jgi:Kef-type K+ transport system membrane component KefB
MIVGMVGGKVAGIFKLPNVSGYLVFGLLLGPSVFDFVTKQNGESFTIISELALAVIAFSIGSEFLIKDMKKVGKAIVFITFTEVVGAVFVVFGVMYYIFNLSFAFSIVLASMSAATAPAATLLVIRQYRAHGPLTKTLLPIVALDDVFGIMAFGIAMAVAKLSLSTVPTSMIKMISGPLIEIGGSAVLGLLLGYLLAFLVKKAKNDEEVQLLSIATIAVAAGLSNVLKFSPLLTNIVIGTVLVNVLQNSNRSFSAVNKFISPFYVLFFTLAGASLDLHIMAQIGLIGVAYIFARGGGKMLGAWFGCRVVKSEKKVRRYLGLGLFPQGGISIGLSVLVKQQLPADMASQITTIIMFGVLVYEVTGPIFSKLAISLAGEINGMDKLEQDLTVQEA